MKPFLWADLRVKMRYVVNMVSPLPIPWRPRVSHYPSTLLTLFLEDLHCITIDPSISSRIDIRHPRPCLSRFDGNQRFRSMVDTTHSRWPTRPKRDFVCLLALQVRSYSHSLVETNRCNPHDVMWYHSSVSRFGLGTACIIDIVIGQPVRYWGTLQQPSTQELPGGQFTLGGVNTSLFTGEINYIGLSDVNWWTIPMDSVVLNGQEIPVPAIAKGSIIDTGTTLVGE